MLPGELEAVRAASVDRRRAEMLELKAKSLLQRVGPAAGMEEIDKAAELWNADDRPAIIARMLELKETPHEGARRYTREEIDQYMAGDRQLSEEEIERDMKQKRIPRGMGPVVRDRVRELMREADAKGETLHTSEAQKVIEQEFGYRFDYHSFSTQYFFRARQEETAIKEASDASNARAAARRNADLDAIGVIELNPRSRKAKPTPAREVLADTAKTESQTRKVGDVSITISITSGDPAFITAFLSGFQEATAKRSA